MPAARSAIRAGGLLRQLLLWCLLLAAPVFADTGERDLQVLVRTLGFLDPPRAGTLRVGIVYDPAVAASQRDARLIHGLIGSGLRVAGLELRGNPVPLAEAARADVDIYLLAADTGAAAARLAPLLRQQQRACFTTDLQQVQAGHCSVGIQSVPRVEILVHRSLAAESGLVFAAVFRMMIKEF